MTTCHRLAERPVDGGTVTTLILQRAWEAPVIDATRSPVPGHRDRGLAALIVVALMTLAAPATAAAAAEQRRTAPAVPTAPPASGGSMPSPAVRASAAVNGQCAAHNVAQPVPTVKPLTTIKNAADGMPGTQLYRIVEDSDGTMWIAGLDGVVRWDGTKATAVNGPEWTQPLPEISASGMVADSDGGVWVAAGKLAHVSRDGSVSNTDIPALDLRESGDRFWVIGTDRITLYDPATATSVVTVVPAQVAAKTDLASEIGTARPSGEGWLGVVDGQQHLAVIKPSGELSYVMADGSLQPLNPDGSLTGEPLSKVEGVDTRVAGGFWVSVAGDLVGVDGESLHPLPSRNEQLGPTSGEMGILDVPAGNAKGDLIVSLYDGGLQRLKAGSVRWENLDVGVASVGAMALMMDSRGILWYIDWDRGVVSVLPTTREVSSWFPGVPVPGRATPLLDTIVVGDEVWMATDGGGVYALNRRTGAYRMLGTTETTETFVNQQQLLAKTSDTQAGLPSDVGALPSDSVIGLACVGDKVWAGMWDGGIAMIDPVTLTSQRLTSTARAGTGPVSPLINPDIFDITTDADGNAWASVWNAGVQVLTPRGESLGLIGPDGDIKTKNSQPIAILPLGEDTSFAERRGQAAIGGWAGFELIDLSTGDVRRWSQDDGTLTTNLVYSIAEGDDGVFWLGTSAGLERVDTKTNQPSTVLDRSDSLPGRQVMTVTRRGDRLLLGTNQGLAEVTIGADGSPTVSAVLEEGEGLSSTVMARYGKAVAPDGTLYLATANGLSIVSPQGPRSLGIPVRAVISSVSIAGRPVYSEGQPLTDRTLRATIGDEISVTWRVLSYWPAEVARFNYEIGSSAGWTRESEVVSTALATTGEQAITVSALDLKGATISADSLLVVGSPKWFNSWQFRAAVGLLVLLGASWYVLSSRRRRQHLEGVVETRTAELVIRRKEAEQASREIKNLLHRVSHDLRSPLNNMIGAMDLIENTEGSEPPMTGRWIAFGRAAARRLTVMLDDLIVHARTETGRTPTLNLEPVGVEPVVRAAVALAEATDLGEGRAIRMEFDQTSPTVLAERETLQHLLTDVIINALSHSRPGEIVVRCADGEAANTVAIAVIDPGSGLTDDQLRILTEPYRRGEQVGGVGLGLGLTVSMELARRMGGVLDITTEPERTTVELTMTARTGAVRTVLIADDDPTALMLLVATLDGSGLTVVTAASADELLVQLTESSPDLVVVDHHLGTHLGADVVESAPGRLGSPWAPRVIGISSDAGEARADGRYALVLAKPVTPQQFSDAIAHVSLRTQRSSTTDEDSHTAGPTVDLIAAAAEDQEPSER